MGDVMTTSAAETTMSYAFEARGLVKRFGKTTALAGVDLAASPGSVLGLLGPNGAGKTTAVRIFATLARPSEGRATVGGLDVVRQAAQVRRMIGLTGQYASVDDGLTGSENLVLIGELLDLRRAEAKARAAELLDRFGLAAAAGRRVGGYSGGMRRRLDLAASLVGRPRVIFLDEPTVGLDPAGRDDVWHVVRSLTAGGVTVLLTTQYLEEADALADDIAVIDHGRLIAHGTPADLKHLAGGQTITIRPKDPAQLPAAARIAAAVAGREPESAGRGLLTVPADGDAMFTEAVRRLEAAGIGATELALRLPSLDEVFFSLTGRHNQASDQSDRKEVTK
jgi:oleandomycin transport system ATP-binding protein